MVLRIVRNRYLCIFLVGIPVFFNVCRDWAFLTIFFSVVFFALVLYLSRHLKYWNRSDGHTYSRVLYRLSFQQPCCSCGSSSSVHSLQLIIRLISNRNFDAIVSAGVTSSTSQFFCLQFSRPYVLCCFVRFPGDTKTIGSAMKFVLLRNEMEPEHRLQFVYTHFIWVFVSDCFGHLRYRSFAQCPDKYVLYLYLQFFPILGQNFFVIRQYCQDYVLGFFHLLDKFPPRKLRLLYRLLLEYGEGYFLVLFCSPFPLRFLT